MILGKILILGATDTQVATSFRGYSATVEHCTSRPISSVQRSNRKLCSSSSSSNSSSKIRSFRKIFLRTFKNVAHGVCIALGTWSPVGRMWGLVRQVCGLRRQVSWLILSVVMFLSHHHIAHPTSDQVSLSSSSRGGRAMGPGGPVSPDFDAMEQH